MYSKIKPLVVNLGVTALLLYLFEPGWLEDSFLNLVVVISTLYLTTRSVVGLLIRIFKPSLFTISFTPLLKTTLNALLLVVVCIKMQDYFAFFAGLTLGIVLFLFAILFQQKKLIV